MRHSKSVPSSVDEVHFRPPSDVGVLVDIVVTGFLIIHNVSFRRHSVASPAFVRGKSSQARSNRQRCAEGAVAVSVTGQGAALAAVSGRGLGGLIGSPTTSHRYNLSTRTRDRLWGTSRRRISALRIRLRADRTAKDSTRRPTIAGWNRRSNSRFRGLRLGERQWRSSIARVAQAKRLRDGQATHRRTT
jgi:hypothetical protein